MGVATKKGVDLLWPCWGGILNNYHSCDGGLAVVGQGVKLV